MAAILGVVLVLPSAPLAAQPLRDSAPIWALDEVRLGALDQNVEGSGNEGGVAVNAELLFGRPAVHFSNPLLEFLFRPRPHLGASFNTVGATNEFYFGATWDLALTDWAFLETSFGVVVHDGPLAEVGKASFGCRLNFRESASLGFALSERWRLLLTVDHMSNANLCERNRGLTNAGMRLGYKLD